MYHRVSWCSHSPLFSDVSVLYNRIINMRTTENSKWYNNGMLVDMLLFVMPPLGIYGVYKTRMIKSNTTKILYGSIGFTSFVMALICLVTH